MGTEIKNAVSAADKDAQYDEKAKRLLGNKDAPTEYNVLNRAIFYVSRLISSQKERDFINTNYDDIKQVFSIWICMNINQNCMNYVHLTNDRLLGSYEWEGKIDLLGIVLIGLSKELPEHDEKYELHRLLGALLSRNLSSDEKLKLLKQSMIFR